MLSSAFGYDAGEAVELAVLRDLARRLDEGVHGDARERAADADAAHAERGKIIDREAEGAAVEKVDRLRRDRLDGRAMCSRVLMPGE